MATSTIQTTDYLTCELNVSINYQPNSHLTSIYEYWRYSRYGRLVIIDFGGLVFDTNAPFGMYGDWPQIRTRIVAKLFKNEDGTAVHEGFTFAAPSDNAIYFQCPANEYMYGQVVYLTD